MEGCIFFIILNVFAAIFIKASYFIEDLCFKHNKDFLIPILLILQIFEVIKCIYILFFLY